MLPTWAGRVPETGTVGHDGEEPTIETAPVDTHVVEPEPGSELVQEPVPASGIEAGPDGQLETRAEVADEESEHHWVGTPHAVDPAPAGRGPRSRRPVVLVALGSIVAGAGVGYLFTVLT